MLFPQLIYTGTLDKDHFFHTQNRVNQKKSCYVPVYHLASQGTLKAEMRETEKWFDDFSFHNKIYLSLW